MINRVAYFLSNEIISVNISKTKTYAFIAIVLRCSCCNLSIFIPIYVRFLFEKSLGNKKKLKRKNVTRIKK